MTEEPTASPPRTPPPGRIAIAAAVLGLDGIIWVLYGSTSPIFPWILDEQISDLASFIGVVAAVTALGVWRLQPLARALGAGLLVAFLVRDLAFTVSNVVTGDALDIARLAGDGIWIAVDAIALYILVRRWPVPDDAPDGWGRR